MRPCRIIISGWLAYWLIDLLLPHIAYKWGLPVDIYMQLKTCHAHLSLLSDRCAKWIFVQLSLNIWSIYTSKLANRCTRKWSETVLVHTAWNDAVLIEPEQPAGDSVAILCAAFTLRTGCMVEYFSYMTVARFAVRGMNCLAMHVRAWF